MKVGGCVVANQGSFVMGNPKCFRCTLIWCVRPVRGRPEVRAVEGGGGAVTVEEVFWYSF